MWLRVLLALGFRYLCYAAMIALCLYAEQRPAPHLPDLIVDRTPYVPWVDRWNYWMLMGCYVPLSIAFLLRSPARFCRYTVTAGLLSLLRGVCIALTGLGPVRGPDSNAGLSMDQLQRAWLSLLGPVSAIWDDAAHVYLTKDLFFSGHTGITFLLLLYLWADRRLRPLALVGHLLIVVSIFLAHLHYSIDVVGAYCAAFSLFVLREGWPPRTPASSDATRLAAS